MKGDIIININDIGIQDYKRDYERFQEVIFLKIYGIRNEYKMMFNDNGWLQVIIPIDNEVYYVSLLDIFILLGKV